MTTPRRDNARLNTGEVGTTGGYVNPHSINKIDRIRLELARPHGNRLHIHHFVESRAVT